MPEVPASPFVAGVPVEDTASAVPAVNKAAPKPAGPAPSPFVAGVAPDDAGDYQPPAFGGRRDTQPVKAETGVDRVARENAEIFDAFNTLKQKYGSADKIPDEEAKPLVAKYNAVEGAGIGANTWEGVKGIGHAVAAIPQAPEALAVAAYQKVVNGPEVTKFSTEHGDTIRAASTSPDSDLSEYISDPAALLAYQAAKAEGKYIPGLMAGAEKGPGLVFKDYDKADPTSLTKWVKSGGLDFYAPKPSVDSADRNYGTEILRAIALKAEKNPKALTPAEQAIVRSAPVVAISEQHQADQTLQGVGEGFSGTARMAGQAAQRIGEAATGGTTAATKETLDRLATNHFNQQVSARGLDKDTMERKGTLAAASSFIDPAALATGEAVGALGAGAARLASPLVKTASEFGSGVLSRAETVLAEAAAKKGAIPIGTAAEEAGTGALQGLRARGAASRELPAALRLAAGVTRLAPVVAKGALDIAEDLVGQYGEGMASTAANALTFGSLAGLAGEDNPGAAAGGVMAGHLMLSPVIKAAKGVADSARTGSIKPLADAALSPVRTAADVGAAVIRPRERVDVDTGGWRVAPTGDAVVDAATHEAASTMTPEQRALTLAAQRGVDKVNARGGDTVMQLVVKTPEQAKAIADLISSRAGEGAASYDPASKGAGFTSEPVPADIFGNKDLAGKKVRVAVTFTDSPLFKQALGEEAFHGIYETLPEKFRADLDKLRTPEDTAALKEQGVAEADMPAEFAAQQGSKWFTNRDFAKPEGVRQVLTSFLESVAGGKAGDTVGTRGLARDRKAQGMLTAEARRPGSVLDASTSDFADKGSRAQPTRFTAGEQAAATPEIIAREARTFDPAAPERALAARTLLTLPATATPDVYAAALRDASAKSGHPLSQLQIQNGVDRMRELKGLPSTGEVNTASTAAAEAAKAAKASEVESRAAARLEASGQKVSLNNEFANAKFEGRPVDLSAVKWENFSPEERAAIEDKASRFSRQLSEEAEAARESEIAKAAKEESAKQKVADKEVAAEEQRRYEAYWNQLKRGAADEAARAKVEAAYQKESDARAKAAEEAAAVPADQRGLETAFGGMKPSQRAQMVAKASNTLAENFKTVLASERSPIVESLRASVKELPTDADARRSALLDLAQQARDTLMGDQGQAILDSATTFRHPEGMTDAQWKAVADGRGRFVLGAEADALVHSILRRLLGDKSSAVEIDAAVKASDRFASGGRDEARAARKETEAKASTDDYGIPPVEATPVVAPIPEGEKAVVITDYDGKSRLWVEQGPPLDKNGNPVPGKTVIRDLSEIRDNIKRVEDNTHERVLRDDENREGRTAGELNKTKRSFGRNLDVALAKLGVSDTENRAALMRMYRLITDHFNSGYTPSGVELSTMKFDPSKTLFGLDPYESAALMSVFGENYSRRGGEPYGAVDSVEALAAKQDAAIRKAHDYEPMFFGDLQKNAKEFGLKNTTKTVNNDKFQNRTVVGTVGNLNREINAPGSTFGLYAGNIKPKSAPSSPLAGAMGAAAVRAAEQNKRDLSDIRSK